MKFGKWSLLTWDFRSRTSYCVFFDSAPLRTKEWSEIPEFLKEVTNGLYCTPKLKFVYSADSDKKFKWEHRYIHTYATKQGTVDPNHQMMRLFTLMYDMAVSRLDSASFRKVATERIADSRNTRKYMRVI